MFRAIWQLLLKYHMCPICSVYQGSKRVHLFKGKHLRKFCQIMRLVKTLNELATERWRRKSDSYLVVWNMNFIFPYTLWLFNIAMKNGPFIDDFPIKTSIYGWFSMAMLNNQMVLGMSSPTNSYFSEPPTRWRRRYQATRKVTLVALRALGPGLPLAT